MHFFSCTTQFQDGNLALLVVEVVCVQNGIKCVDFHVRLFERFEAVVFVTFYKLFNR